MLSGLTGWTVCAVTAATAIAALPDWLRNCPLVAATNWWCWTWFWWCSINGWWYGAKGAPYGPVPVTYSVLRPPQATRLVGAARPMSLVRWPAVATMSHVGTHCLRLTVLRENRKDRNQIMFVLACSSLLL